VHHLVVQARWQGAIGRWLGVLLEAHQGRDLAAQLVAVEVQGLFAAAVEREIGLDLHGVSLLVGLVGWFGIFTTKTTCSF